MELSIHISEDDEESSTVLASLVEDQWTHIAVDFLNQESVVRGESSPIPPLPQRSRETLLSLGPASAVLDELRIWQGPADPLADVNEVICGDAVPEGLLMCKPPF